MHWSFASVSVPSAAVTAFQTPEGKCLDLKTCDSQGPGTSTIRHRFQVKAEPPASSSLAVEKAAHRVWLVDTAGPHFIPAGRSGAAGVNDSRAGGGTVSLIYGNDGRGFLAPGYFLQVAMDA